MAGSTQAGGDHGPPPYQPAVLSRLVGRVQILNVELVWAHFERADSGPLPEPQPAGIPDALGIAPGEWSTDGEGLLGCLLTFFADFNEEQSGHPYRVVASFRLIYQLEGSPIISDEEGEQFVAWNAVFNAWPYWREYLSSTLNRAGLERFLVPVMGVPRMDNVE